MEPGVLAEAFLYATVRTGPGWRHSGLRGDAVALWSRATRRRAEWREHERRCREMVAGMIGRLPRRERVVVLGSGLLRDIDLRRLAEAFGSVVLVDAVHLLPARLAARRSGAETRLVDLTGVLADRAGPGPGRVDPVPACLAGGRPDLVVSANVLSQLPMAAERRDDLLRDRPDLPAQVVRWHLDDLRRFGCAVCLLTDVSYRVVDRGGATLEAHDLLRGQSLPEPVAAWDWTVAPFGETARDRAVIHRVHAYPDWAAAR